MAEKIDPRYDPVFQRGYQARADASVEQVLAPPPTAAPGVAATVVSATVEQAEPVDALVSAVTVEVLGGHAEPVHWTSRMPNPFVLLLWLLGPALVVLGNWAAYSAFTIQFVGQRSAEEAALQQLVWVLSPAVVTTGILIIAGLLFWHAVLWRRAPQ